MADEQSSKICSVDGCGKKHHAKGFCCAHHHKWRRYGDPLASRQGHPIAFLRSVIANPPDECVIWPFGQKGEGYGVIKYKGRNYSASRLSLILYTGNEPDGMVVRHGPCNNRGCVNPLHLSFGTIADNNSDKWRDGTMPCGQRSGQAKLTEDDVRAIRADTRRQVDIAKEYDIDRSQISRIKARLLWGWLD